MEVTAALCEGPGQPLSVVSVELALPAHDEVLIEIRASGICHSDHAQRQLFPPAGRYPIILGHEGAGVVVACGRDVTEVGIGDHVVPLSLAECGTCGGCRSDLTNICDHFLADMREKPVRFTRGGEPVATMSNTGTFATHIVARERNVAKIRKDIPFDIACAVGCAVATGIGGVLYTARVRAGSSVVIFGLGGVGLNVAQGARLAGARQIVGVDTNPDRAARSVPFGVTDFIDAGRHPDDLVAQIHAITGGGADYAFECVGNARLMEQALESTRLGWGVCTLLGVLPPGEALPVSLAALQIGRTLTGSYMGNVKGKSQLPQLLDLYAEGRILLDEFVTHRVPLARINEGFDLMLRGEALRAVVEIS